MRRCGNCRFANGCHAIDVPDEPTKPTGSTTRMRQGWCRRLPPAVTNNGQSSAFPPIRLEMQCGEHRFTWPWTAYKRWRSTR